MTQLPKDKPYRILFIGNSYTYCNDIPNALFEVGAKSVGYDLTVESVTSGGYTLERHSDPEDPIGATLVTTVDGKTYDCIIYQEQSVRPHTDKEKFLVGLKALDDRLKRQTARSVLYATWGRKEGNGFLERLGLTSRGMGESLAAAYKEGGELIGADVANVGLAFADVSEAHPEIELYNPDESHPSLEGSYLATLILLKTVFGIDPDEVEIELPLTEDVIAILKDAAKKF